MFWSKGDFSFKPQRTKGDPYTWRSTRSKGEASAFSGSGEIVNTGTRHPRSVLKIKQQRGLHPTQKPVELFEFLIRSYSNENDLVCDPFLGSGTTAVAAAQSNRRFVGCDISEEYVNLALDRLNDKST